MKTIALCVLLFAVAANAKPRSKREAFELPDGADLLVGSIRTSFACPQGSEGYFADVENNCQIFHVCHTVEEADGNVNTQHFSFLCGNQTVFSQLTFTCASPEEALPCPESANFFYLNENLRLGDPKLDFLSEQDIQRAAPLILANAARYVAGGGAPPPPPQRPPPRG